MGIYHNNLVSSAVNSQQRDDIYRYFGFRVQGSGCRVQGSGFRVQGSGFRIFPKMHPHIVVDLGTVRWCVCALFGAVVLGERAALYFFFLSTVEPSVE